jgi:uncharacterized repeat protein (TIGR03837 family)
MSRAPKLWDIFCKVIDNYGDIGVCWRLCADLAARGEQVRLWVDDATALQWMAPQGCKGVEIRAWTQPLHVQSLATGDVLVEAFGCDVAPEYIANYSIRTSEKVKNIRWINLEYLSAEAYAARSHGLPSPVLAGPSAGLTKHFFYPGFSPGTGGLLREPDLLVRQAKFDREAWLQRSGITLDTARGERLVSLFCYEPPALDAVLQRLAHDPTPTRLLVTYGRAAAAVLSLIEDKKRHFPTWNIDSLLSIVYLPPLTQLQFDELLWACDLNFVRGEDSLVRAIWAGKPFVWQIYPQDDGAHHAKLNAFLTMMAAPPSLRRFWLQWNSIDDSGHAGGSSWPSPAPAQCGVQPSGLQANGLEPFDLPTWGTSATALRTQLLAQTDLTGKLLEFINRLG